MSDRQGQVSHDVAQPTPESAGLPAQPDVRPMPSHPPPGMTDADGYWSTSFQADWNGQPWVVRWRWTPRPIDVHASVNTLIDEANRMAHEAVSLETAMRRDVALTTIARLRQSVALILQAQNASLLAMSTALQQLNALTRAERAPDSSPGGPRIPNG